MKKIISCILAMMGGLFYGCSDFEIVRFENQIFEDFFNTYDFTTPALKEYMIGDVLVIPYLTRSVHSGAYDIRVSVWSKSQNTSVIVVESSVDAIHDYSHSEVEVFADNKRSNSELYTGYLPCIENIKETALRELDKPEIVVRLKISESGKVTVIDFPFEIIVERIGAPSH